MRTLTRALCGASAVAALSGTRVASAQPVSSPSDSAQTGSTAEPAPPPLEIGVEAYAFTTFANACTRSGDVIRCTNGTGALGLAIVPRWRMSKLLSLGGIAAYGSKPSVEADVSSNGDSVEHSTRLWRLAAEGRLHPLSLRRTDPWVALEAGVGAISDVADTVHSGQTVATSATTQWAPSAGGGLGVDFYLSDRLALGVEGRGLVLFFSKDPDGYANQSVTSYATQPGAWFAVTATLLPAL